MVSFFFYNVIGEKPSKTSKIGCFSNFYRLLTPPKSYAPRSYMHRVNTRILRPFWSKSVEKHQCYRRKTIKNVKNRVFFEFLRPPRPKIKNRASLGHAPLQYATFEGSLKKIGWETKKFMQNNVWWWWWPSASNGNTYIIHTGKRLTYRVFSYQLGGVFVSWWGSFKVGRPCQGVNYLHNWKKGLL